MYELIIHDDATGDLRSILEADRSVGLKITRFLAELRNDQDLLDRLTQQGFGGRPNHPQPSNAKFNAGRWAEAQQKGMNLWRVRLFDEDVLGFRFLYAFNPKNDQYVLLAIAEKADVNVPDDNRFNYELSHPLSQRVAAAYKGLVDFTW